jgi:hypothetical protein
MSHFEQPAIARATSANIRNRAERPSATRLMIGITRGSYPSQFAAPGSLQRGSAQLGRKFTGGMWPK